MSSQDALAQIYQEISRAGLVPRGALRLADDEREGSLADVATIVLAGTCGGEGWSAFANSAERQDGRSDPLDRWSRRIIDQLAVARGAKALYPFGGPPYLPFQRWAMRAEPVEVSPLGMLIHPEYGLWHSYRGALGFVETFPIPEIQRRACPCDTCLARPCLSACPVGAFTNAGYNVDSCASHLLSEQGQACMNGGCLARRACPAGAEYRQGEDQARFHMKAFLAARIGAMG
ncbi:MAG TPA: ferredoxin [Roseiarcus sp.]|nr:ferredoxin [Roseiarcus sp.]